LHGTRGSIDLFFEWEDRKMSHSISIRLFCGVGLVGLLAMMPGARTGSAQSVNDMVRTLNNVLNPSDAQRLEDQARRNGRPQEECYWHDTAPVWIRPTGTVAITGRTIADAATTATRGVRVFPVTAAIGATIPIKEITATLRAKKALGDDTG
jgi:hypothetical protein